MYESLRIFLERALALHENDIIKVEDLNLTLTTEFNHLNEDFDNKKLSLESYLEDIEKKALSNALEENRWNKTATAKQLGLTFRSLRYRLKKLGLE